MEARLQKLFTKASSLLLSNVTFDALDGLDEVEVCSSYSSFKSLQCYYAS